MICAGVRSVVIIALSDIHSETRHFAAMAEALTAADVVFIAGDITHFGGAAGAREVIEDLRLYNPSILAVPGNCDGRGVQEYLACEGLSLHDRRVDIDGVAFAGLCRWLDDEPAASGGPDMYARAAASLAGARRVVFLTHQPAYGTVIDTLPGGRHGGNRETRALIERIKPLLAVSGHIHEAPGTDRLGPTTLVNPGPARRGRYARIVLSEQVESVELCSV